MFGVRSASGRPWALIISPAIAILVLALFVIGASASPPPAIELVSVDSAGNQTTAPAEGILGHSELGFNARSISSDGRFVVFSSNASNLVAGDMNASEDVFVRDIDAGTTQRVSVSTTGSEGNGQSFGASISSDGGYIVFLSHANNLVPGDNNPWGDVFVYDRQTGQTERVNVNSEEVEANSDASNASISGNGRYVAFQSSASNLVPDDSNAAIDIFVRDRLLGITERANVSSDEEQADPEGQSDVGTQPTLSLDGRYVVFESKARNLVPTDTGTIHEHDIFVRDRALGTTEQVSVNASGVDANGISPRAVISGNGRYVAFFSSATNLVGAASGLFVRDQVTGQVDLVSVSTEGVPANGEVGAFAISDNGRYVVFDSEADNLVANDTNTCQKTVGQNSGPCRDVFVRDRELGKTQRVSVSEVDIQTDQYSRNPAISGDGTTIVFSSKATNLVITDINGFEDVFVVANPITDGDSDGVPDTSDICPDELEDVDGFEDTDGCPDPDNDSDGILDVDDACPDLPGVPEENGCPPPGPPLAVGGIAGLLDAEAGGSTLSDDGGGDSLGYVATLAGVIGVTLTAAGWYARRRWRRM